VSNTKICKVNSFDGLRNEAREEKCAPKIVHLDVNSNYFALFDHVHDVSDEIKPVKSSVIGVVGSSNDRMRPTSNLAQA